MAHVPILQLFASNSTSDDPIPYAIHLTRTIVSTLATIPYILFMIVTFSDKSLLRPKDVFKSNFSAAAIIHLVSLFLFQISVRLNLEHTELVFLNQTSNLPNLSKQNTELRTLLHRQKYVFSVKFAVQNRTLKLPEP